ncbi:MAG TPA: peptidase S41, partial [Ohtaekwangia sp.]|nr:peptidase S41 [Ohtaekwangia sp.]
MKKNLLLLFLISCCLSAYTQSLWLRYPCISPDGKRIAFSYKGDLYTVPSEGGVAAPLTLHEAYDYAPVWSPDSKHIAFASNRFGNFDIYLVPATGGDPKRLTIHSAGETPSDFSPDGKHVIFSAHIEDLASNLQMPNVGHTELYSVPIDGGKIKMVKPTVAIDARYSRDGKQIIFHDWKGYEDDWRKHHTSSVTRDIWSYDVAAKKHTQLSSFKGEDRNPVFSPDGKDIFFLTEQFGDFNVARLSVASPQNVTAVTDHQNHPVRFLSISNDGTLCYTFNGELYTRRADGNTSQKLNISIPLEDREKNQEFLKMSGGATEFSLSPDGKELALIIRGEVFVVSTEHGTSRRITNTPEQERTVSFSPDGKALLYAAERNGSWKIYQTRRMRAAEKLFALSTILREEPVLESDKEAFQPKYSPDGKEVAFLEERTTLKVINLATKQIRTILDGKFNYSYADGDQWYDWSPDGKWFLVSILSKGRWSSEVGLVDAQGKQSLVNLTNSGYEDGGPKWMQKGKSMIWFTDKYGMRSHGSWGSQGDVYAMFFTKKAWNEFRLNKEEFELQKGDTARDDTAIADKESRKKDNKGKEVAKNEKAKTDPVVIELEGIEDRTVRLTINSSDLNDAVLSPDGEQLYYLARFEKGYDLWVHKFREKETKLLVKLEGYTGGLQIDKEGKFLFAISG